MFVLLILLNLITLGAWGLDADDIASQSHTFYTQNQNEIQAKAPQACHDYYRTLLFLGYTIKTTDDVTQKDYFKKLLFGMIHTGGHWGWSTTKVADDASIKIFERVAYGAFVAHPDLEPQASYPTTALLKKCKDDATPKTLNDHTSYIYCPEFGKWMVLEKMNKARKEQLLCFYESTYIEERENIRSGKFKYLPSGEGLHYFNLSLKEGPLEFMHYAYLTQTNPEGKSHEILSADMVMTLYATNDNCSYSPMGISRTIEAAQRMTQNKVDRQRFSQPESVLFHTLAARLVHERHKSVSQFLTWPVLNMSIILMLAIHPECKETRESIATDMLSGINEEMFNTLNKMLAKRRLRLTFHGKNLPENEEEAAILRAWAEEIINHLPWKNVILQTTSNNHITTIPLTTLSDLLYPHT